MTDEEILYELRDQRHWWETQLEKAKAKVKEYEEQVYKVSRLISLLEHKAMKDEDSTV